MRIKNLFLLSAVIAFMFVFTACDDDDSSNNNNLCGNGQLDPGEDCDGENLNSTTCTTLNSNQSGTLRCDATCHFDTSECVTPECGNGIVEAGEECDGTAMGAFTECASYDASRFTAGTLACAANCTYDVSACEEVESCKSDNFEECNPVGGADECCDHNGFPSQCSNIFSGSALCLQTCDQGPDCGWSMDCNAQIGQLCFYGFCGGGMQGTPINSACTLTGDREGWCYPLWRAMDDAGICFQNGTQEHGEACVRDDNEDPMGSLDVNAAEQCDAGLCIAAQGTTNGHCIKFCDPVAVYDAAAANDGTGTWNSVDTCPENFNCINFSNIDLDQTNDDGTTNPNFLFREADYGVCYPATDGVDDVITEGLLSCDLISGKQIKTGEACPEGKSCQYIALGNLLGACQDVADASSVLSVGDTCTMPDDTNPTQPCEAGSQCFMADPFNDTDYANNPTFKCAKICDYNAGFENNPSCAGLVDGSGNAYVCLSTSRFFTSDFGLPTTGTAPNVETEASPSRLAFCVPPAPATK